VNATDTHTDPLAHLAAVEEAFQDARARLKEAETERYASIWAALTTASDMAELRAVLPATVSVHSLRAAVRRHATGESHYIQPELFEDDPGTDEATAALTDRPARTGATPSS
jgi:hypothetical protein